MRDKRPHSANETIFNLFRLPRNVNPALLNETGPLLDETGRLPNDKFNLINEAKFMDRDGTRFCIIRGKSFHTGRYHDFLVNATDLKFISFGENKTESISIFRFPFNKFEATNVNVTFENGDSLKLVNEGLAKFNVYELNPDFTVKNPFTGNIEVYDPSNKYHSHLKIYYDSHTTYVIKSRGYITQEINRLKYLENTSNTEIKIAKNIEKGRLNNFSLNQ